jgi:hypothetical protein
LAQTNELVKLPETSNTLPLTNDPASTANQETSSNATILNEASPTPGIAIVNNATSFNDSSDDLSTSDVETTATPNLNEPSAANPSPTTMTPLQELSSTLAVNEAPATLETTNTPSTACSSFDETGLLATFDNALVGFISDASALYGNRYENLQYELSSKQGVINGEQGTVSTDYSGTVKELSTGQDVSANGTITATFSWDGCAWQVVDYSF